VEVSSPPMWCRSFARLPPQRTLCRSRRFLHGLPPCRNCCLPTNQAHNNLLCKGSKSQTLNYRRRAQQCNSNVLQWTLTSTSRQQERPKPKTEKVLGYLSPKERKCYWRRRTLHRRSCQIHSGPTTCWAKLG
jgi:hypothetical protein